MQVKIKFLHFSYTVHYPFIIHALKSLHLFISYKVYYLTVRTSGPNLDIIVALKVMNLFRRTVTWTCSVMVICVTHNLMGIVQSQKCTIQLCKINLHQKHLKANTFLYLLKAKMKCLSVDNLLRIFKVLFLKDQYSGGKEERAVFSSHCNNTRNLIMLAGNWQLHS